MNRNRNLTVVLALAAGLLGGFLSRYITLPSVHAQVQLTDAVEIRSQRFTFVDPKGRVIATFTRAIPKGRGFRPQIALVDPDGRELWSAGVGELKPLAENSK